MKNKGGRPCKLTKELLRDLISGIKRGRTLKAASQHVGITYRTLSNWIAKGAKAAEPNEYSHLASHIKLAKQYAWGNKKATARIQLEKRKAYLSAKAMGFIPRACQSGIILCSCRACVCQEWRRH